MQVHKQLKKWFEGLYGLVVDDSAADVVAVAAPIVEAVDLRAGVYSDFHAQGENKVHNTESDAVIDATRPPIDAPIAKVEA